MTVKAKTLFLIDGMGALLSAFLLWFVLAKSTELFGMPTKTLHLLSALACVLALSSLLSFSLVKRNHKAFLKIIAFANLGYCCLTAALVYIFFKELTALGLLYFFVEITVILTLAIIELRTASKKP